MTMMCARCYIEGRRVPVGMRVDKNPPFAFIIYEGESRCVSHLPAPAVIHEDAPMGIPNEFPPLEIAPEPIQTDNRFVVAESAPAKKAPAKRPARKRTKS